MALQASPDAAAMAKQLMGTQESKWRSLRYTEKSAGKIITRKFEFFYETEYQDRSLRLFSGVNIENDCLLSFTSDR